MPYLGLVQYADWAVAAPTPTFAAFDRIDGGTLYVPDADVIHREGIRGQDSIVYGMVRPRITLRGILETAQWVQHAQRATVPVLPQELAINCGVATAAAVEAWALTGAYINELSLAWGGIDEPIRYTVEILATAIAAIGSPSPEDVLGGKTMEGYAASLTIDPGSGADGYTCDSWETTLRNGIEQRASGDAADAGYRRDPEYIKVGTLAAEARVTVREPLNIDLTGDAPEDVDYDLAISVTDGTLTGGLAMANLVAQTAPQEIAASEDEILWAVPFEGVHWDLNSWLWTNPV